MQFTLSSTLATLAVIANLAAPSTAFVMDTFSGSDCSGSALQSVNVWDNTCATWMDGFGSFKITTYGGPHQQAYFFAPNNCGDLATNIGQGWVDGGGYKIGTCYTFGSGHVATAASSYSS